ncbi:MAG: hypothetical protein ACI4I1_10210 [Oscillospiraceae bacterium]
MKGTVITGRVIEEPKNDECIFTLSADEGIIYSVNAAGIDNIADFATAGSVLTVLGRYDESTPQSIKADTIYIS